MWLAAWLVVEAGAVLLDIGRGPWSTVGFEEGRNARAALQLACGHGDRLLDLQYRDFCGGCTGVAVLGAPLLRLLGDHVAVWKLVPAAFHLALVAAVGLVAHARTRPAAALAAMAMLSAAPEPLRELSLTAWGNHAEVRAGVVGAAALLLARRSPAGTSLAAGVLTGLSIWFAHISIHALPALALLAARRGRRGLPFAVGLPLGLLPWWAYLHSRPTAVEGARVLWLQAAPADPVAAAAFLTGPLAPGGLWPTTGSTGLDLLLAATTGLGVTAGAVACVVWLWRREPLALFVATATAGFVAAVLLRPDLWADVPAHPAADAFHLRYRATLWPLVALSAGLAVHLRPRAGWLVVAPLLVVGLVDRADAWTLGPGPSLWTSVGAPPGRPDATVPEGQPHRRTPWRLDRPRDIEAATRFLTDHSDALPACRVDHQGELGRRIGLHVRRGGAPELSDLDPTVPAVVDGVAWGLHAPAGAHPRVPAGSLPAAWEAPVAAAVGRLEAATDPTYDGPGACLGHARQAWRAATDDGRVRAVAGPPEPPPGCSDLEAWTHALVEIAAQSGACPPGPDWPPCGGAHRP